MKRIDSAMLDVLTAQAKESPRQRANYNLHPKLDDPVNRLCIAMEPGTYVRPHCHVDQRTWEVLVILRGKLALLVFDDEGRVLERAVLTAGGTTPAVEFPEDTWHATVSLEPGTVVFEVKKGPYVRPGEKSVAPWAPAEGTADAARLLDWYRNAAVGDRWDQSDRRSAP
jgi:cupin fold WbuC family metalloprotein